MPYTPPPDDSIDIALSERTAPGRLSLDFEAYSGSRVVDASPASASSGATEPTVGAPLGGTCSLNGSPVEGAVVYVVNADEDRVVAEVTSGADGAWSAVVKYGYTYHVAAQYDDGTDTYNEYSNPFLVS